MVKKILSLIVIFLIISPVSVLSDQVEKGHLSITDTKTEYRLTGKWKFAGDDNLEYARPDFDDSHWKWVSVPGQWHMLGIKGIEVAWYRLYLDLSEDFRNTLVSIRVPVIADSHQLYLNGKLVGGSGVISAEGKIQRKSSQPGVYYLPEKILNYGGSNVLALRVGDDVGWGGIVTADFYLGNSNRINRKFQRFVMWNTSIVLIAFFLGVYYFILYLYRRQEKTYFHFSMLALIASMVLLGYYSFPYWVFDNFWFNHFIFHSGMNIGMVFALHFAYAFFEYPIDRIVKITTGICAILFMVLLLTPFDLSILKLYAHVTFTIALILDGLGFCYLFFIIVKSIRLKKLGARTIGMGGLIAIICFVNDILGYLQILDIRRVGTEGFVVLIVSFAFAMALKFSEIYDETDRLNISLEKSHDQLAEHNKAFEKFVPRQFLNRIAKEGVENIILGKAEGDFITLLFSDIRSFTELSEQMSPQEVLDFLNNYLKLMNEPIHAQLGFVDKFVGDAIMAIFDLPELTDEVEAQKAIQAAIGMQEALKVYNQNFKDRSFFPVHIGIGIHSGPVVIGTVGSEDRMDSTVLGDAVNLASRLEGLTKYYGSQIITSYETLSLLNDITIFKHREIDRVQVKGKSETVRLFEIFDAELPEVGELKEKTRDYLLDGLAYREQRNWQKSTQAFNAALEIYPGDKAAVRLMSYTEALRNADLPDDWDGSMNLQEK